MASAIPPRASAYVPSPGRTAARWIRYAAHSDAGYAALGHQEARDHRPGMTTAKTPASTRAGESRSVRASRYEGIAELANRIAFQPCATTTASGMSTIANTGERTSG